ncbi:molecular chaperone TorD family protein [Arcobacteraceae bacterium]|nr:molecular chaperone TorD family protein [Arcobacteraceae bacterium]
MDNSQMDKNQVITKARGLYYNLFANFFIVSSDTKNYLGIISLINILKDKSLDSSSQEALNNLADLLDPISNVKLMEEYDALFYSPMSKNIRLTASFYDEGVESGKKRLEMIQFIGKTKLRRDEKEFYEYEDFIGFIFAFLAELCDLVANGEKIYENTIHCIFDQILNDFADDVAKVLYEHDSSKIYKELMIVLHSFLEFERLYLDVSKPKPKDTYKNIESPAVISEKEKERRAKNKALKALGPKKKEDESCPIDVQYDMEDSI